MIIVKYPEDISKEEMEAFSKKVQDFFGEDAKNWIRIPTSDYLHI
jgi:hypothetical protein